MHVKKTAARHPRGGGTERRSCGDVEEKPAVLRPEPAAAGRRDCLCPVDCLTDPEARRFKKPFPVRFPPPRCTITWRRNSRQVNDKLTGLLGLSRRAGHMTCGFDAVADLCGEAGPCWCFWPATCPQNGKGAPLHREGQSGGHCANPLG